MLTITLYWLAITVFALFFYTMCFVVAVMMKQSLEQIEVDSTCYEDILVKHLLRIVLVALVILLLLRVFVM